MTEPLAGQIAVVTGASRGIGRATAQLLAARGAEVVLAARDAAALTEVATAITDAGGRCWPMPTDVSSRRSLDDLVSAIAAQFDAVHILINNAGILPRATRAERLSADDWDHVLAVNLTAVWHLSTRLKPMLADPAVVVNVTSTAASYPSIGLAPYNVSKAGVTMLTRALALEWAAHGVRVLGVAPGKVQTSLVEPILRYVERTGQPLNVLDRIGQPDEVAELIGFLVSGQASYMTGSVVVCDGGELLQYAG